MINGAHVMIFSRDAEKDREFLRDVLRIPSIDSGGGWLIFKLPPAELGVHPADSEERHELYLMCEDIDALIETLASQGVECAEPAEEYWGRCTGITLPGGGKLGVYQPRHTRPGND